MKTALFPSRCWPTRMCMLLWPHHKSYILCDCTLFSLFNSNSKGFVTFKTFISLPFLYIVWNNMNHVCKPSKFHHQASFWNRPFPSSPRPLFENEGRRSAFDMDITFRFHANITHFHKKGCAPSLILKVRVFGTRKRPIVKLRSFA